MNRVCMYGEHVSEALARKNVKGGAELQMALLARVLASNGVPVTIVDPMAVQRWKPAENLTIESVPDWNKGIRGLRFLSRRIPMLIRSLRATNATVYYTRGFSFRYLLPLYVARRTHARFVLAVASDTDLLGFRERYTILYKDNSSVWAWMSTIIPNELAHSILGRLADVLLVQHEHQAALAHTRSAKVMTLSNVIDDEIYQVRADGLKKNIIVVGTLSVYKGLHVLIPVVERLRNVSFEFIGEVTDKAGEDVRSRLVRFPNVRLHGPLDRKTTLAKIAGGKALLNTSPREGFPNTFMEAWALGTPVISLFADPGGVIQEHHLGFVCSGDMDLLEHLLQQDTYDLDMERIKHYLVQNHSCQAALRVFDEIFEVA